MLRSGAREGDRIYLTGELAAEKHLDFRPRLSQGQWLSAGARATACIDVSDSLVGDLHLLLQASGAGAVIDLDALPLPEDSGTDEDTLNRALYGGEDYELLFTVPADSSNALEKEWKARFDIRLSAIGHVTGEVGNVKAIQYGSDRGPLDPSKGYDHFG